MAGIGWNLVSLTGVWLTTTQAEIQTLAWADHDTTRTSIVTRHPAHSLSLRQVSFAVYSFSNAFWAGFCS